jgi:hypothetical protein
VLGGTLRLVIALEPFASISYWHRNKAPSLKGALSL